jgi:signal transduction histidine kinase
VRAIAHAHGGEAMVESPASGGSVFRVSLPASVTNL